MFHIFYTNKTRTCITQMPVDQVELVTFPDMVRLSKSEAVALANELGYVVEEHDDGSLSLTPPSLQEVQS